MKQIVDVLDAVLSRILVLLMLCLVAAVLWQVISRYALGAPSSWTEELARFLLIWISLLGAAFASRTGMHLALDVLQGRATGRSAAWLKTGTLLLVFMFSATVLVVGGSGLSYLTWELKQHSAVLGLPMAFVYSVIPVSGVLICFYAVAASSDDRIGRSLDSMPAGE